MSKHSGSSGDVHFRSCNFRPDVLIVAIVYAEWLVQRYTLNKLTKLAWYPFVYFTVINQYSICLIIMYNTLICTDFATTGPMLKVDANGRRDERMSDLKTYPTRIRAWGDIGARISYDYSINYYFYLVIELLMISTKVPLMW